MVGWMTCSLLIASLLAACAATTVTTFWKDPAAHRKFQKVLVIGMLKKMENRRSLEDEFAGQLQSRGISATAGYSVLPDEKPTKEIVAGFLKGKGYDAVLLIRLIREKKQRTYVEGGPAPTSISWGGYYASGYYTVDRIAYAEANLFDVETEKLVWTAASETWLKASDPKMIRDYVSVIMEHMQKQDVVP